MSSVTSLDASRPVDLVVDDEGRTDVASSGPALHSVAGGSFRPAGGLAALGGLLLSAPSVVLAGWIGGAGAGLIASVLSAVWTALALSADFGGARQPSTAARLRGLRRRATTLGGVLAMVGVSGSVPLDDVRLAFPVLVLSTVGSVLAVLHQARTTAPQRVVLVGTRPDVEAYAAHVSTDGSALLVGACVVAGERSLTVEAPLLVPTVRSLDRVAELATEVGADAVVVVPGLAVDADDVRALTWDFQSLPVTLSIAVPIAAVARHRMHLRSLAGQSVIDLAVPRVSVASRFAKTAMDRVGALVLLVLASPVLLVMWAAVRWDSQGPGFFAQTRVGRDGVPFRMYKMRSMHTDAEARLAEFVAENEMDSTLFKIRRDPRVTRIGYLLRRSSLDELPQLWNVLRGDMSLIGPRPALPAEAATYTSEEMRRLTVLPGITGLWQVSGRSDLTWDQAVRLDLYYADNWRILDDLAIAARTVAAVTQARGAY